MATPLLNLPSSLKEGGCGEFCSKTHEDRSPNRIRKDLLRDSPEGVDIFFMST